MEAIGGPRWRGSSCLLAQPAPWLGLELALKGALLWPLGNAAPSRALGWVSTHLTQKQGPGPGGSVFSVRFSLPVGRPWLLYPDLMTDLGTPGLEDQST